MILDVEYREWIKGIDPDGCVTNFFVLCIGADMKLLFVDVNGEYSNVMWKNDRIYGLRIGCIDIYCQAMNYVKRFDIASVL